MWNAPSISSTSVTPLGSNHSQSVKRTRPALSRLRTCRRGFGMANRLAARRCPLGHRMRTTLTSLPHGRPRPPQGPHQFSSPPNASGSSAADDPAAQSLSRARRTLVAGEEQGRRLDATEGQLLERGTHRRQRTTGAEERDPFHRIEGELVVDEDGDVVAVPVPQPMPLKRRQATDQRSATRVEHPEPHLFPPTERAGEHAHHRARSGGPSPSSKLVADQIGVVPQCVELTSGDQAALVSRQSVQRGAVHRGRVHRKQMLRFDDPQPSESCALQRAIARRGHTTANWGRMRRAHTVEQVRAAEAALMVELPEGP